MMTVSETWQSFLDDITGDINRLSDVWRYSSIPVVSKENDVEHLGWVCIYSLIIHSILRPNDTHIVGSIATHAISHDITESITGDIVRTFKYSDPQLCKAIKKGEEKAVSEFPQTVQWLLNVHKTLIQAQGSIQYEEELHYVETVVKMGDFLSLWRFMRREILRNNKEITPFVNKMIIDLNKMKNNVKAIDQIIPGMDINDKVYAFYRKLAETATQLNMVLTFGPVVKI